MTPGYVLGVVRAGEPPTITVDGLASLEHRVPIHEGTVFPIASLSKQFTAYAVALLVADGRLSFDDPVATWLSWFPFPDITIDQLIRHRSGLRDQWQMVEVAGRRMEDVIRTADVVRMVTAQRSLNFAPGSQYGYSNTGYTLLGLIVAQASGLPLNTFCTRRIFDPLGMTHSRFVDDHHEVVPDRADSYEALAGGGYRRIALSYSTAGATNLHTTVPDLARWAVFTMTPEMRELREHRGPGYGLGVKLGDGTVWHAGADAAYRSHFLALPDKGTAAIVLANSSAVHPQSLCEQALGLEPDNRGENPPNPPDPIGIQPPLVVDEYVGLYFSDEADTHLRVLSSGLNLRLARPTIDDAPLLRVGAERFVARIPEVTEHPEVTVEFNADHNAFTVSMPGARGVWFHRIRSGG